MNGKKYITTGEAAKILRVTTPTVLRWVKEGLIPERLFYFNPTKRHACKIDRAGLIEWARGEGMKPEVD